MFCQLKMTVIGSMGFKNPAKMFYISTCYTFPTILGNYSSKLLNEGVIIRDNAFNSTMFQLLQNTLPGQR